MSELFAEHIIGLRALEYSRREALETAESVRERFDAILNDGILKPRTEPKILGEDGNLFALDRLAGDSNYVFLSYGPRYRQEREPALCYGFLFDAETLITRYNALVGPDMMDVYDSILGEVAREVDASLPSKPPVSDADIATFMALMGEDDAAMAAYIQQQSTSRYYDICDAVSRGELCLGSDVATEMFVMRAQAAQDRMRLSGESALESLQPGDEIIVPGHLPLDAAVGYIKAGEIHLR